MVESESARSRRSKMGPMSLSRTLRPTTVSTSLPSVAERSFPELPETEGISTPGPATQETINFEVTGSARDPAADASLPHTLRSVPAVHEMSPPRAPPSKHMKARDSDNVRISAEASSGGLTPSTANAYMWNAVPVFADAGFTRTPGPAPHTQASVPPPGPSRSIAALRRETPALNRTPFPDNQGQ